MLIVRQNPTKDVIWEQRLDGQEASATALQQSKPDKLNTQKEGGTLE